MSSLQSMCGFVIVDYTLQRLVSYATAAQNATCIIADAVRLATMVVSHAHGLSLTAPDVFTQAQRLLHSAAFVNYFM
jgi:hypothetical protein